MNFRNSRRLVAWSTGMAYLPKACVLDRESLGPRRAIDYGVAPVLRGVGKGALRRTINERCGCNAPCPPGDLANNWWARRARDAARMESAASRAFAHPHMGHFESSTLTGWVSTEARRSGGARSHMERSASPRSTCTRTGFRR